MIYRQKILIALVQELGSIAPDKLHLLLFLYCNEFMPSNHYYDFIPTCDGPISLQAIEDKKLLVTKKILEKSEDWIASQNKKRFAVDLDFFEKISLQDMKNQNFISQSVADLRTRLAEKFPYYFSDTAIKATDNSVSENLIFYTIGYEGLTLEAYINKLIQNNVRLLCDVRKNAYSQKYGFTKGELESALTLAGIGYYHMPELGIVSEKRQSLYTDADYKLLFDEYEATTLAGAQSKLDELAQLLEEYSRIAITCFEADCYQCHRSRVAKALKQRENFNAIIKHL